MNEEREVTMRDMYEAKRRIQHFVHATPIQQSFTLQEDFQAEVYMKLENIHQTGSFKIRGAANKLLSLTEVEKRRGVVTFSTGNHGVAVASVAKTLDIQAVICISHRVPTNKVVRLEKLGAKVVKVGDNQDDAENHAYHLAKTEGLTVIPPFDDREIIAGQGTIGLELIEQIPSIDMAIIPVSGGGLCAGISKVLKTYHPEVTIVGVSMEKSAVMYESIRTGEIVRLREENTLADSLLGGIGVANRYTFSMAQKYIDLFVLVSESEIKEAMALILNELQYAIEGAAATSVAAILSGKVDVTGKHVATIITGRNVDPSVVMTAYQHFYT